MYDSWDDTEEGRLWFWAVPQGSEDVPEGKEQRYEFPFQIRENEKDGREGISNSGCHGLLGWARIRS